MFGHEKVEGERRGLYPVWVQPDVAKRAEPPVSFGGGATGRPADSVATKVGGSGGRKGKTGIRGAICVCFAFRLSDFEVLQVIRVIHRLFSIACGVAQA